MSDEALNIEDSKYSRLEQISWWEQDVLAGSKIMVAGCGALGNEIIKNLVMLGAGNLFVVDMDTVELSNLTRSVLFRKEDLGKSKAEVCAKRAKEINEDTIIKYFFGNIFELGAGVFKEMDIVICGLDNREARLFINQSCWKANIPWIDGAIEVLSGVTRMFVPPDGVCYECTMTETDYELLNKRKTCMLLGIDEIHAGKIPTTPTISSVIAGIQVQEAVKYLHNRKNHLILNGKGFVFNGITNDSYIVEYQEKENCLSHYTFENVYEIDFPWDMVTLEKIFSDGIEILKKRKSFRDDIPVLKLNNEIVTGLIDENGTVHVFNRNMNLLKVSDINKDGVLLTPVTTHSILYDSPEYHRFKHYKIERLGIPYNDILELSAGGEEIQLRYKPFDFFKHEL